MRDVDDTVQRTELLLVCTEVANQPRHTVKLQLHFTPQIIASHDANSFPFTYVCGVHSVLVMTVEERFRSVFEIMNSEPFKVLAFVCL